MMIMPMVTPVFVGHSSGVVPWSDPVLQILVGLIYVLFVMGAACFFSELRTEYFNRGVGRKIKVVAIVFPIVWITIVIGYAVRWLYRELTGYGE